MHYHSNNRSYRRSVKPLLGLIRLRGKLQGEVFYMRNGKQCVRAAGNMDGERFWNDSAFTESQKTTRILGASAKISKVLRDGMGPGASALGGHWLHSRMTKVIQKGFLRSRYLRPNGLIKATDWLPGFSNFWVKPQRGGLQVSDFGRHHVFIDEGNGGDSIWSFRGSGFPYLKDLPKWAGFVRFSVIGVAVSDVLPKTDGKGYLAVRPDIHGARQVRRSPLLPIREVQDFSWKVNLDGLFDGFVLNGAGMVVIIGVECFDKDRNLAMLDASVPFGSLLPGWDSAGVPEGVQSRERFMGKKWKEAGLAFRALEVVYAGNFGREQSACDDTESKDGLHLVEGIDYGDQSYSFGFLLERSFLRSKALSNVALPKSATDWCVKAANSLIVCGEVPNSCRTFSHHASATSLECQTIFSLPFLTSGVLRVWEADSS